MGSIAPFCLFALWGMIPQLVARDLMNGIPRKTVLYQPENLNIFWKSGVSNFSTLLVSEETNTLYVGAKDYILALDLDNISQEITREPWLVPEDRQFECLRRGKSKEECHNYILVLHKINATGLYVCGTNAFHPSCRHYMVINREQFQLQMKAADGRGKCPFEPTVRYASLMFEGALYSATSNNFLGTEPIILRSLKNTLRTEFKASWLNEPTFIHMDLVQESDTGSDKVYVFFTETAVEFEFYDKLLVSRVAQICKDDLGGKRTLRKRWTSFLKSTLACSVPESDFQFNVLQDIFVLKTTDRRQTIFYGIFTQQWGRLDISAICVFRMQAVQDAFRKGNFKGPLAVEDSHMKWVVYRGDIPTPRPGACVDISAQRQGYNSSLDLPDRALQFARDHPLIDGTVSPIGGRPALLQRAAKYTKLVVDRTSGLDNETYDILFLGTDKGFLHKAFNCLGEILLLEEIQLFHSPEPVQTLQLVPQKGLLYAGSPSQLVQLPVATCRWYEHCVDCVLAREPYCAWSLSLRSCILVANRPRDSQDLIQSIRNRDASKCPKFAKKVERHPAALGSSPHLGCTPLSNLAKSIWVFNGSHLQEEKAKYLFYAHGLVVLNVTGADAGLYECQSVEKADGREFHITMAAYLLHPLGRETGFVASPCDQSNQMCAESILPKSESTRTPKTHNPARQKQPQRIHGPSFTLMLLSSAVICLFLFLLSWNIYRGHFSLPWKIPGRRLAMAEAVKSASPELSLEPTRKSPTTQTVATSAGKSTPPGGLSEEGPKAKAKQGSGNRLTCGSSVCLVTEKSQSPRNGQGV